MIQHQPPEIHHGARQRHLRHHVQVVYTETLEEGVEKLIYYRIQYCCEL